MGTPSNILFTPNTETKLQENFLKIFKGEKTDMDVKAIIKIFHPYSNFRWYIISQDPEDKDYLWTLVKNGNVVEFGSVLKSDLVGLEVRGLKCERDLSFKPQNVKALYQSLRSGKLV